MWSVQKTWKMARRAAGFLGGLLVGLLLAAAPAAGATFSDPMTLSNGGEAITPAGAVTSSGQVYVAWREGNDIWFNYSVQRAGSCGGPARLEFPNPAQNLSRVDATQVSADNPSVAATDGGGVFVVWRDKALAGTNGVTAIRFRRSTNGGVDFAAPQSLDFNRFSPIFPVVAADDGGVFVAWQDTIALKSYVLLAQSLDGGANFTYGNVTANRRSSTTRPSVASDGSKVHVVWRESGFVWYKGFTRGSNQATLDGAGATQLTTASVIHPPKIAVHGSQVTAAWLEGTALRARTATAGNFDPLASPDTLYSSANGLSSLSISFGGAGPFFAWQEADFSIHYLLGTAAGTLRSSSSATNPAAPSVGQDGTDRLVASWQETATTAEIKLAYTGGSTGGDGIRAEVRVTPPKVNLRTMDVPGQPTLTVFIQLPDGSEIAEDSVKMNEKSPIRGSSVVGDHNGDGYRDVMLKFSRSVLKFDEKGDAITVPTGKYKVKGNMSGGCFFGEGKVDITP